jgi:hypothetical protein
VDVSFALGSTARSIARRRHVGQIGLRALHIDG